MVNLKDNLKHLMSFNRTSQLTFAYLTCKRLLPNYEYFSRKFSFGNTDILHEAVDFLYHNIFKKDIDISIIEQHNKNVENNIPDTEDFSTIFVSFALDACNCILDSLDILLNNNSLVLETISSYATDSVDMYIREINDIDAQDPNLIQIIETDTLMIRELSIQQGIITFLGKTKNLNYEDIQTLLELQGNKSRSNLNL
ncbi:DUF416 family protein [Chitinophagaceae bacterium LWZ2-11]